MNVEMWPIDKLVPYARNARKNDGAVDAVAASLKEYGWRQPIVVDAEGVIIAGHTRHKAARKLGMVEVPVHVAVGLSPAQVKAYRLADNKVAELATWDDALLGVELEELKGMDFDLALTGFDAGELRDLAAPPPSDADAEPQMSKAEELAEKWCVKSGQLWKLGEHRILCGDSGNVADVQRVMMQDRACLVFTDPPYGVSIAKKNKSVSAGASGKYEKNKGNRNTSDIQDDDMSQDELKTKLLPAFTNIREHVMADDCTVMVTAPQGGDLGMMMMMMMESGLKVRHVLNWVKEQATFSMGRLDYDYQHEPILMTWLKRHKRPMNGTHKTSCWNIDKPRASADHPTMKPVELVVNAILNHTDHGDVTFDAYSGSGTSIMAAEQTGRRCRAIEIMPGYVAVAIQRWADATGRVPERMA